MTMQEMMSASRKRTLSEGDREKRMSQFFTSDHILMSVYCARVSYYGNVSKITT